MPYRDNERPLMTEPQPFCWKTLVLGMTIGSIIAMNFSRLEDEARTCHAALAECQAPGGVARSQPPSPLSQTCDSVCQHMGMAHVNHERGVDGHYMCSCVSDTSACRWYNFMTPTCVSLRPGEAP